MKLPNWTKNITKKMAVIWAVSFVCLLVIIFGSISLGLGAQKVTYGASIDYSKIMYVEYRNDVNQEIWGRNEKQLMADDIRHTKPMQDIVSYISKGSKTNKLSNLFRGGPTQEVVNNTADHRFTASFKNSFPNNSIILRFADQPQYYVENTTSRSQFKLTTTSTATNEAVYAILIPLDRTQNRFQQQTWYLLTIDDNRYQSGQSLTISNKINTYGNYHELGKYVRDLEVYL